MAPNRLICIALALLATVTTLFGMADLDQAQASALVSAYLVAAQALPANMQDIELNESYQAPGFFMFDVMHRYDRPGSVVVGFFAVNKKTGDIWETVLCRRISSRRLSALQRDIRRKSGLSATEWQRFHALRPMNANCE